MKYGLGLVKFILIVLLLFPILAGCGGSSGNEVILSPEQQETLTSYHLMEKIEKPGSPNNYANLYTMTYSADYEFDRYLQVGSANFSELMDFLNNTLLHRDKSPLLSSEPKFGCASFTGRNEEGHVVFGRNFDQTFTGAPVPILIVYTSPPAGYASISIVNPVYFYRPGDGSENLLFAPYFPIDGVNEAGLAVAVLYDPNEQPAYDPGKITIWHCCILRLLLDRAGNVSEAITLLQSYNIDFAEHHIIIADRSGDSAVVEYHNRQMSVVRSGKPWQVVTNYSLAGSDPEDLSQCWRYQTAWTYLKNKSGFLSKMESMTLLGSIAQDTFWSAVYDLESAEVQLACVKNYQQIKPFHLSVPNQ